MTGKVKDKLWEQERDCDLTKMKLCGSRFKAAGFCNLLGWWKGYAVAGHHLFVVVNELSLPIQPIPPIPCYQRRGEEMEERTPC